MSSPITTVKGLQDSLLFTNDIINKAKASRDVSDYCNKVNNNRETNPNVFTVTLKILGESLKGTISNNNIHFNVKGNTDDKCSNVQMFKCSNVQMFKCSNVQMFKCSNVQMFKCSNVQMFKCSNVQMFKCSNVQMK